MACAPDFQIKITDNYLQWVIFPLKAIIKHYSGALYGKSYYPFFQFMAAFADLFLRYTRMRSSTISTSESSVVNSGSGNDFGIGLGAGLTGFIGKHWSAQLGFGLGQVGYSRARSQSAIGSSLVGATQSSDLYIISNIFSASATNLGIYYAF
ncbi:MAG: hypothetical protein INR69_14550 [Mucilaginibacter polytrichastri]|nr:hypothetical protein [Mucilaginibacter polytrichastri]